MVQIKKSERRIKMWVPPSFRHHVYKLKAEKYPNSSLIDIIEEEIVRKKPKKKQNGFWGKI